MYPDKIHKLRITISEKLHFDKPSAASYNQDEPQYEEQNIEHVPSSSFSPEALCSNSALATNKDPCIGHIFVVIVGVANRNIEWLVV